jgi:hypothetical protein
MLISVEHLQLLQFLTKAVVYLSNQRGLTILHTAELGRSALQISSYVHLQDAIERHLEAGREGPVCAVIHILRPREGTPAFGNPCWFAIL